MKILPLGLLTAIAFPLSLQAQLGDVGSQIDWGTSVLPQTFLNSSGSGFDIADPSVDIELGAFTPGFVPTIDNLNDWIANWQVFDAINVGDEDSADTRFTTGLSAPRFAGTDFLLADQTSSSGDAQVSSANTFAIGQQAYVFIRDSDQPVPGAEWLLYTNEDPVDAWTFPAGSDGQQAGIPLSWVLQEADTAVIGSINTNTVGGGEFTDPGGDFDFQTHTFVPEPSAALLLMLGSLGLVGRRHRKA